MSAQGGNQAGRPRFSVDARVGTALRMIEEFYRQEKLTPAKVAKILAISYSRLQFLVKRDTGSSLQWHFHAARIRLAAMLLRRTELLVKQVAAEVGYSTSSLERHFERFFGCSPTAYRNQQAGHPDKSPLHRLPALRRTAAQNPGQDFKKGKLR